MKVGIIGAGLIGHKRALGLGQHQLIGVCDLQIERTKKFLSLNPKILTTISADELLNLPGLELVVVATTNDQLAAITIKALEKNLHVLVEKPAARSAQEFAKILPVLKKSKGLLKIGFNHRYHPALLKAHELFEQGELGDLMFIRARYGHGGRVGYEKEWRADARISGGGELIDQGVHLIDLAQWFLGPFSKVSGSAHTYFWDMKVDDNAFLNLETPKGQKAWLQVSCSEWKNTFSMEIYGKNAKVQIDGLGGSYGVEKCTFYKMLKKMGPPETTTWEYPFPDQSWEKELQDFCHHITDRSRSVREAEETLHVLEIVEKIYKESGYAHHA